MEHGAQLRFRPVDGRGLPNSQSLSRFFYHYDGSSHRPLEDEEVATLIWQKGAKSFNRGKKGGNIERCRMSAKKKNGLLDAMRSAVQRPIKFQLPFWLPGAPSGSPAHPERARDYWAVRNGLVHLPSCRLLPPTPAFFGLRPSPVMWLAAPPRPTQFFVVSPGTSGTMSRQ